MGVVPELLSRRAGGGAQATNHKESLNSQEVTRLVRYHFNRNQSILLIQCGLAAVANAVVFSITCMAAAAIRFDNKEIVCTRDHMGLVCNQAHSAR
jgi:hypothetical protein